MDKAQREWAIIERMMVGDYSPDQPRDDLGRFSTIPGAENSAEEQKNRLQSSYLDATIKSLEIKFPDGTTVSPVKGTSITKHKVIAGSGHEKHNPIKDKGLFKRHPNGKNFSKMRGEAVVEVDGVRQRVEVHWYESANTGIVEMKFKRFLQ